MKSVLYRGSVVISICERTDEGWKTKKHFAFFLPDKEAGNKFCLGVQTSGSLWTDMSEIMHLIEVHNVFPLPKRTLNIWPFLATLCLFVYIKRNILIFKSIPF